MQHSFKFNKVNRIVRGPDFKLMFNKGKKVSGSMVCLYTLVQEQGKKKSFGVIVSRKIKGSVRRNRYKRLAREYFRLQGKRFRPGTRMLAVINKPVDKADLHFFEKEMEGLVKNTKALKQDKHAAWLPTPE